VSCHRSELFINLFVYYWFINFIQHFHKLFRIRQKYSFKEMFSRIAKITDIHIYFLNSFESWLKNVAPLTLTSKSKSD